MCAAVDELQEFEQWRDEVLPLLKGDVRKGLTPGELREKYMALLTARLISIGLTEKRASAAIVAIKDILDRVEGKAIETKEIRHKLESLPEQELDALLLTKMKDISESAPAQTYGLEDKKEDE